MSSLDTMLETSITERVEVLIRELRAAGETTLPSESEIARRVGANRFAVRRILEKMQRERQIFPGAEHRYVLELPHFRMPVTPQTSYTRMVSSLKLKPRVELLDLDLERATADVAGLLEVEKGTYVWRLEYLRYYDDIPGGLSLIYIPVDLTPKLNTFILKQGSLYAVLEQHYGMHPRRRSTTCEAVAADAKSAKLMKLPRAYPLLKITNIAESCGRVMELSRSLLRSDVIQIHFDMSDQLERGSDPCSSTM